MFTIEVGDKPHQRGAVLGTITQTGVGAVCDCTLAVGYSANITRTLTLPDYPRGVEPVCALVARLLALIPTHHPASDMSFVTHACLNIYRGTSIRDSQLVERMVARRSSVFLDVEFFDGFDERSATHMSREYRSALDLLQHAAAALWWSGEAPPSLFSLSHVPVHQGHGTGIVLEQEIPAYTRARMVRYLGSGRRKVMHGFLADDWRAFLASLGSVNPAPY